MGSYRVGSDFGYGYASGSGTVNASVYSSPPRRGAGGRHIDGGVRDGYAAGQRGGKRAGDDSGGDAEKFKGQIPCGTGLIQAALVSGYTAFVWLDCKSTWCMDVGHKALLHGAELAIVALIGFYMFRVHKRSQARGYLRFYRSINMLRRVPLLVLCVGNVLVLPIWAFSGPDGLLSDAQSMLLLQIIATCEAVCVVPTFLVYSWRVQQHNVATPLPDAQQLLSSNFDSQFDVDEMLMGGASPRRPSSLMNFIGRTDASRQKSGSSEIVTRWQADMIKFLQVKVRDLQEQVMSLVEQQKESDPDEVARREIEHRKLMKERDSLVNKVQQLQRELIDSQQRRMDMPPVSQNVLREMHKLQQQLKEERRGKKRVEALLEIEREAHREAQNVIESLGGDGASTDGGISSSFM